MLQTWDHCIAFDNSLTMNPNGAWNRDRTINLFALWHLDVTVAFHHIYGINLALIAYRDSAITFFVGSIHIKHLSVL